MKDKGGFCMIVKKVVTNKEQLNIDKNLAVNLINE